MIGIYDMDDDFMWHAESKEVAADIIHWIENLNHRYHAFGLN